MNQTRTVSGVIPLGKSTMACTKGTVRGFGHPADCATRLTAPSAADDGAKLRVLGAPALRALHRQRQGVVALAREKGLFARTRRAHPAATAAVANSWIRVLRSITRSGRRSAIFATRPSVNNSNRRISLTTALSPSLPRISRMRSVTISVRGAESSRSCPSKTRASQPARASL